MLRTNSACYCTAEQQIEMQIEFLCVSHLGQLLRGHIKSEKVFMHSINIHHLILLHIASSFYYHALNNPLASHQIEYLDFICILNT